MNARPWERQRGEPERAYTLFLRYRDMDGRSLERVAKGDCEGPDGGNQPGTKLEPISTLKKLSAKHDWPERARAWDVLLQQERDKVAAEQAAAWERRRLSALEDAYQDAEQLRARAHRMLAFPLQRTVVERDASGQETTTITPAKWSVWTAAQMLKLAMEIQQAVLAAVSKDPAEMTDAELRAVADELLGPRPPAND